MAHYKKKQPGGRDFGHDYGLWTMVMTMVYG